MSNVQTPLVIFAVERLGWCFHNIALALQNALSTDYRFKTMLTGRIARETCDVLVCFWWDHTLRVKANVKARAVVTCLYDELSWHINESSRAQFKLVLRNTDVLAVCNEGIAARVREVYGTAVPEIMLIEDGVDTDLFAQKPLPDKFCVGWTGNSARHTPGGPDDLKGLGLVRKAADAAGVELHVLDASAGGAWPLVKMPEFYAGVSTVVIASACEGTPNPLLEGLACGRPVISTPVGIAPKAVQHGVNGLLITRSESSIRAAMEHFSALGRMELESYGREARKSAMAWSWKKKADGWRQAIRLAERLGRVKTDEAPGRSTGASAPPRAVLAPVQVTRSEAKPRREPHRPPKVLAISDVPNWAFHVNMMDMAQALAGRFQVDHWFVADWQSTGQMPDFEDYDVVFCVYHRWGIDHILPWDRTVGSLRALWFWPETPRPPGEKEFSLVNRFRAFHVVTKQNYEELKDHCPNAVYLTNPVNMDRFPEQTPVRDRVVASWNGNARHMSAAGQDVKGFWPIIVPVIKQLEMPFEYAEYHTNRLAPKQMPEFFSKANLAICMSLYEGASNSVMEAMASGQALITTAAGNAREMHEAQLKDFGESGIMLIERDAQHLADALTVLRNDPARVVAMGELNREEIKRRWSWDVWKDGYAEYLKKALP